MSVALVQGDTAEYERIEAGLRKAGFEPFESTFAWKRTRCLGVKVEFFCPASRICRTPRLARAGPRALVSLCQRGVGPGSPHA